MCRIFRRMQDGMGWSRTLLQKKSKPNLFASMAIQYTGSAIVSTMSMRIRLFRVRMFQ